MLLVPVEPSLAADGGGRIGVQLSTNAALSRRTAKGFGQALAMAAGEFGKLLNVVTTGALARSPPARPWLLWLSLPAFQKCRLAFFSACRVLEVSALQPTWLTPCAICLSVPSLLPSLSPTCFWPCGVSWECGGLWLIPFCPSDTQGRC